MKRKDFLRSAVVLAGGAVVLGCERDLVSELLPTGDFDKISIDEARTWFEKEYLLKFERARQAGNDKKYRRKANWNKAENNKDKKNRDFVWVPVDYENDNWPAVVSYDETTEYRMKLAELFIHPIIEGLVVTKEKGKTKAFLAQIAYDPYVLKNKRRKLALNDFTGWLLKADWEDSFEEGVYFSDGKTAKFLRSEKAQKGARPACVRETITHVSVSSCGMNCTEVTVHAIRYESGCGGGNFGGSGAGDGYGEGQYDPGFRGGGGSSGGSGTGSSSGRPLYIPEKSFNLQRAVCSAGMNRSALNKNLENAVTATGLATNITGWSLDKAEAMARSMGGEVAVFKNLIDGVGVAGIIVDGVQLGIGLSDGKGWGKDDTLNAIQLGLGVTGLIAGGWIAVTLGAISIGVAVYAQRTDGQPACQ